MHRIRTGLAAMTLSLSVIFGGSAAPGRSAILLPEVCGLALLALMLWRGVGTAASGWRAALAVAALLALPLLQLLPLPPELWSALPGRGIVADVFSTAGIGLPWEPLSLTPEATERFASAVLPALAIFVCVSEMPRSERSTLVALSIGLGIGSVGLGLVQVGGGPDSPFRVYPTASRTDAVALFANRNHYAAFLYILIPLTSAFFVRTPSAWTVRRVGTAAFAVLILMIGVTTSGSRAGLALGVAASLASLADLRPVAGRSGPKRRALWMAGVLAAASLLMAFGLADVLLRVRSDSLIDDLRWQVDRTSLRAAIQFFPAGSGFGSFPAVYQQFEGMDQLIPAIVNNAHNDWIELVIEGGGAALLIELAALIYLIRASAERAMEGRRAATDAFGTAALIVLWLVFMHSAVDYPLRTMAVNVMLALTCGLRCRYGDEMPRRSASRSRRRRGVRALDRSPSKIASKARRGARGLPTC